jgi:hypothetical protein
VIGLPALREALSAYLRDTRHLSISPENIVIAPGTAPLHGDDGADRSRTRCCTPTLDFPVCLGITLGLGGVQSRLSSPPGIAAA